MTGDVEVPRLLYTKAETAKVLRASQRTVDRLVMLGRLRRSSAVQGRVLFVVDEVHKLARTTLSGQEVRA